MAARVMRQPASVYVQTRSIRDVPPRVLLYLQTFSFSAGVVTAWESAAGSSDWF